LAETTLTEILARRFAVLALALLAPPLRAQVIGAPGALAPAKVEAIEAAVSGTMSEIGIPGLSLALATDGEIRIASGYGLADVENNVPAKAVTVYRLASVSKPITAVAVLQLAEKGLLDLDAPIQKYCPAFPEKPWPVSGRQLLGHLGGVRHYADNEPVNTLRFTGVRDGLAFFKDDPLAVEPGTRFLYSTYGYSLLGCAVEGASGQAFADYLRDNVFRPAEMERTRPDDVRGLVPNRAQGYVKDASGELLNSALADVSYKVPGGGLVGTAPDVARFALALANGSLLKKEMLAQMLTRQKTRDGKVTGYGLGWTLGERKRHREAWHTGGQERVSNAVYWQPDTGLVVALLSNLEHVQPHLVDLARRLADLLQLEAGAPALESRPKRGIIGLPPERPAP
jgi:CubicO group peptidase (beta-lactamase class C family)